MIDRPSLTYGLGQLESICAASKLLVSESAGFGCVPAMCASRVSHKHLDSHLSPLLLEFKKKKKKKNYDKKGTSSPASHPFTEGKSVVDFHALERGSGKLQCN